MPHLHLVPSLGIFFRMIVRPKALQALAKWFRSYCRSSGVRVVAAASSANIKSLNSFICTPIIVSIQPCVNVDALSGCLKGMLLNGSEAVSSNTMVLFMSL